jgi:hypothetical protein
MSGSPTVYAVDTYDIFDNGGALVWWFPVQQHAISLDSGERHLGRDGDLEAEEIYKFFDGLGEHSVGAEGHPIQNHVRGLLPHPFGYITYQKSASSTEAVFNQPDEWKTSPSML